MEQYQVTGMSCAACSARVEKAVMAVEGVTACSVSLLTNSMGVEGNAGPEQIIEAVKKAGYGASLREKGNGKEKNGDLGEAEAEEPLQDTETPVMRRRLVWSLCLLLPLMYLSMGHTMWNWPLPGFFTDNHVAMGLAQLLLAGLVMVINQKFFVNGFRGILHGAPNMDTLVALGSGASFVYSTVILFAMTGAVARGDQDAVMGYMHGFYFESAAMILALITVGKLLEARSKGRTTDALKSLMKLAPKTAVLLVDGQEKEVPIASVKPGDLFVVRPGDTIPVDGIVKEGNSAIDEAMLTGESIPVDKEKGDGVSAGTLNQSGFLCCEATRVGEDTAISQIIQMVSDAAATKAPIAKIADRVSGVFVPVVMGIAAVTFLIWLVAGQNLGFALARGICVLVISCPCALGLATPVAIMVGNGVAAKSGILFKTAVALEETGKIQIVALDKTGTITEGHPVVTDVIAMEGIGEEELLETACALEQKSEHPLARAVVDHAEGLGIKGASVDAFQAVAGNGLTGRVTGKNGPDGSATGENGLETAAGDFVYGGNFAFMKQCLEREAGRMSEETSRDGGEGPTDEKARTERLLQAAAEQADALADQGKTPMFFGRGNRLLGIIAVSDVMKEDSVAAIDALKRMGAYVVMLTGDNARTAKAISESAGVDEVAAGVLPDGKAALIDQLKKYGKVAMVGDGINDAPALTKADIGIAIGAGTDVAISAADVVLMKSSLTEVPAAIRLGRATLRNIKENLFWAFIYNVIGIPLAAGAWIPIFGWTLQPMFGAAAMSLSSFCVVTNALRLNLFRPYDFSRVIGGKGRVRPEGGLLSEVPARVLRYKVGGMMCEHCEATVKKSLEAIDGVLEASADHKSGIVSLKTDREISGEQIREAVEREEYSFLGEA